MEKSPGTGRASYRLIMWLLLPLLPFDAMPLNMMMIKIIIIVLMVLMELPGQWMAWLVFPSYFSSRA